MTSLAPRLSDLLSRVVPRPPIGTVPMVFPCGISRSGTTLLATVVDAHPEVCLGYELVPPPLPPADVLLARLEEGMEAAGGDFSRCGAELRKRGAAEEGRWLARCHRAGVAAEEVRGVLAGLVDEGRPRLVGPYPRLRLAARVMEPARRRTGAVMTGFKLTGAHFGFYRRCFPEGYFVYILRDPRDVLASQRERGFAADPASLARTWREHLDAFERFAVREPGRALLVRYEDLAAEPEETVRRVFDLLPLEFDPGVLSFERSAASVFASRHPNVGSLRRGFFTDSIGRWRREPSADAARLARDLEVPMRRHGYDVEGGREPAPSSSRPTYRLSRTEIAAHRLRFSRRRRYRPEQYEELLAPYLDGGFESLRLIDYAREREVGDRKVLLVRHDVDHDHLTAMKIAAWERERGVKATYCLLHTAWYYGRLEGERYVHSEDLIECARRLVELGHEVNFHNNLAVLALREGIDPAAMLRQELEFFRSHGVPIHGTSTHGDALCRELEFRNWEIFRECCDERFGGPRTVTYEDGRAPRSYRVGELSMADFGLQYEAYDVARDVYHTDSGGNLRTRLKTKGRRPFGRHDAERGQVVGVLTHPIWWNFP